MKLRWFYSFFAFFIILLVCGCVLSSSKESANLILYAINERTENLDDLATSLYTVSEKDGELNKIYEVDAPQQLQAWFSPDSSKVIVLVFELVEWSSSILPGASYTLLTMDSDGENVITWYKDRRTKNYAFMGIGINAQFSAGGKRFLYTQPASEENNDVELYTANPDGTGRQLIDQGSYLAAEFTPKGDRLLVTHRIEDVANQKTIYEVYYIDAQGGDPEVVWSTQEKGIVSVLAKVAGRDQVLLAVGSFSTGEVALSMASDDFREITPILQYPETRTNMLTFSPDGKTIALGRRGDACEIFSVIDVDRGGIRDISCWNASPFQFSSNGKYLLVSALGEYGDLSHINVNQMLLEPDGDLIETFTYPEYIRTTLSPDGNRMAYWSRDPDTKEMCLNLSDLNDDKKTTLDATCVDGATSFLAIMVWK